MSKIRLIDTADRFLLEIDGREIPHVTTYEIIKSVNGYLSMKIVWVSMRSRSLTLRPTSPLRKLRSVEEGEECRTRRRTALCSRPAYTAGWCGMSA